MLKRFINWLIISNISIDLLCDQVDCTLCNCRDILTYRCNWYDRLGRVRGIIKTDNLVFIWDLFSMFDKYI